jgi:4-amino-4-deoxy-L-arabinose transferase-like glycosyltransferase
MPDLGLLQAPPRRAPPPALADVPAEPLPEKPAGDIAERYAPAAGQEISIAQVVSEVPRAASAVPPEQGSAGHSRAPAPLAPRAAAPPIVGRDLLWLALALLVIIGTGLGIRDPWPADEPRFAAIARDMVATGEWLFPRVGGDLYQDKPPLFFWMLAVCYSLIGSVKWSFLIPSLLSAGATLFLIYDFGRRLVSREAGLAASILVVSTLHFVLVMRGAQIDPVLCGIVTFSLYGLLRHLLLGPAWGWYALGGFAAGIGIITKGVGFLPLLILIPYFLMRGFRWKGIAAVDGGTGGWRWWLAPVAMLLATLLWFIPMILAVDASGAPEYAAYRDEILFKQTVTRYSAAWHHVKPWYFFILEVIPALWLPWSLLLFWLVPRYKAAFRERDARVWLPLTWVLMVVLFFSMSPGKRGVYVHPALPALALASLPLLPELLARPGVRRAGWMLALSFWAVALLGFAAMAMNLVGPKVMAAMAGLPVRTMLLIFVVLGGVGLLLARRFASLAAWPVVLGALCVAFSYSLAPAMNSERSSSGFIQNMLARVKPEEELALVAYKEQFLLYLDRPTVNFGHRRWLEGPQESYDAAAWLNAGPFRVLLVPDDKHDTLKCFPVNKTSVGESSDNDWYLVRAPASADCAAKGDAAKAIHYAPKF